MRGFVNDFKVLADQEGKERMPGKPVEIVHLGPAGDDALIAREFVCVCPQIVGCFIDDDNVRPEARHPLL